MENSALKHQIVVAAVTAAGAGAPLDKVIEEAQRITSYLSDASPVMTAIDYAAKSHGDREPKLPFTSTVIHVDLEQSSKRGLVILQGRDGSREFFRTAIVPGNPEAKALAGRAQELIGHQVVVFSHTEKMGDDGQRKVRIVDALVSDGVNEAVLSDPDAFSIDWNAIDDDGFVDAIRLLKKPAVGKLARASQGIQSPLPEAQ